MKQADNGEQNRDLRGWASLATRAWIDAGVVNVDNDRSEIR